VRASDASGEDQGPVHQHEASLAPSNVDLPYDYKQRVFVWRLHVSGNE